MTFEDFQHQLGPALLKKMLPPVPWFNGSQDCGEGAINSHQFQMKKPRVRVLPSDLLSHCSVIKSNQLNYSFNSKGKIRIGVSYTFVTIAIRESFPTRCKTQRKVTEMNENNLITFQ